MKEAIGGSWLFTLIITLLAFFTCFISISTNYTRTYNIKDNRLEYNRSGGAVDYLIIDTINQRLMVDDGKPMQRF